MGKKGRYAKQKDRRKKIAGERIAILLELADKEAISGKLDRASRYGYLARKIGKKYNISLPGTFKHKYCKHCGTYRVPSRNTRVRISRGHITTHCLKCGDIYRRPYTVNNNGTIKGSEPNGQ